MIQYFFSFNPENHLTLLTLNINSLNKSKVNLVLPLWRPGRYQFQNFSKNILHFSAKNQYGQKLKWHKTKKNIWTITKEPSDQLIVNYSYYSNELNAGSCLVNERIKLINPSNLCMYIIDYQEYKHQIFIESHSNESIACAKKLEKRLSFYYFDVNTIHELFDTPFILSHSLNHSVFEIKNIKFHLWIHGIFEVSITKFIKDLQTLCAFQINLFGKFPEKNYHFYLLIPSNSYYHGVEHSDSMVMVLGENGILGENYYYDLLGLVSHELFHAWNIAKIRPIELLPYDYSSENYFETCFVAEGFTTYYGDKILFDSGIISKKQYLHELETVFRRHFENSDHSSQSLLESSFDLWVDGYDKSIPNKTVSVYHKGAIAALILDLKIRKKFIENKSLDNVLVILWEKFGNMKKGYSYSTFIEICENVYEEPLNEYFDLVISSNLPILEYTNQHLKYLNLEICRDNKHHIVLKSLHMN